MNEQADGPFTSAQTNHNSPPVIQDVDFIGDGNARGNQRQKTFLTKHDCQAFLERVAKYHKQYGGFSPPTA